MKKFSRLGTKGGGSLLPVLDASALAGWLMPDETGPDLAALFDGDAPVVAPPLLKPEFVSIVIVSERRGRIADHEADRVLSAFGRLGIVLDGAADVTAVAALARTHRLSAYDATYLELALRRGLAICTLDRALATAARTAGVARTLPDDWTPSA